MLHIHLTALSSSDAIPAAVGQATEGLSPQRTERKQNSSRPESPLTLTPTDICEYVDAVRVQPSLLLFRPPLPPAPSWLPGPLLMASPVKVGLSTYWMSASDLSTTSYMSGRQYTRPLSTFMNMWCPPSSAWV